MTLRINWQRSRVILDELYAWRLSGTYPFDGQRAALPQHLVPAWIKDDQETWAMFYFVLCLWMRGTVQTMTATRGLAKVVTQHPRLLDPRYVLGLQQAELLYVLQTSGLPQLAKGNSRGWIINAQRLQDSWQGSVIKLASDIPDYGTAMQLLIHRPKHKDTQRHGFYGFGAKMVSMLLYYLMYDELMSPFVIPIPIDYRVMRFCLAHRLIQVKPDSRGNYRSEAVEDRLRQLFFDYARQTGANPLLLADAVWLYSGEMCAKHPGNKTRVGQYQARSTTIEREPINWQRSTATYLATCGQCPFESTCELVFPQAHYYLQGGMVGYQRERPPVLQNTLLRGRIG